ncbi:pyrroline-5-carboxylate reductase dimerization domain-containing protein [Rhodovibrionaceae bacterium A322]
MGADQQRAFGAGPKGGQTDGFPTVGFLGVGHLTEFLVKGLIHKQAPYRYLLSPRNKVRSAALASLPAVEVAKSNQALVAGCDLLLVCLPPAGALQELSRLSFRQDQVVLSAMAAIGLEPLQQAVAPARVSCCMMPGHANELGVGPSLIYPDDPSCRTLLGFLGPVYSCQSAALYEKAAVFGGLSGASFVWMAAITDWFVEQGLPQDMARSLVAQTLRGNAEVILQSPEPLQQIVEGVATPGGITHLCVDEVARRDGLQAWSHALDAILARMQGHC